jgi:Mrp family chromosome partitioning ATPase
MANARGSQTPFPIEGDLTHSPAGERYAKVVDRLLAVENSTRQVLVTSPGKGDGKTVTAVNLAFAFHARHLPVLLAELSFARPAFSKIFGPSPLPRGVEDAIAKDIPLQSVVCVRNDNSLHVTMVNRHQETNTLLRPGENFDRLLAVTRASYDWTIFDAPSVDALQDIKSIAGSVGLVVLVVRAGHTESTAVTEALERIAHPNTFVLLNDE